MKPNRSQIIALVAILLVAAWFGVNSLSSEPTQSTSTAATEVAETALPEVVIAHRTAEEHLQKISIYGRTEAIREVMVKAETTGLVVSAPLREGQRVSKGQLICKQDINARQANLDQARAMLRTRELEYKATKTLVEKGYRSETQAATALAALDGARASVKQAEIEIDNINIRAPFSGIFETQIAHIGDFLSPGQPCGLIVDLDPLAVVIELTENQVGQIKVGQDAQIELATGQSLTGQVRLIEARANPATRTFRTEIVIPNNDLALKSGVTATVAVDAGMVLAQRIPSQILSLDDAGNVGVRYLDEQNIVRFAQTTTIDEDETGIWVSGLPDQTRIIVKGQDFVSIGVEVDPKNGSAGSMSQ